LLELVLPRSIFEQTPVTLSSTTELGPQPCRTLRYLIRLSCRKNVYTGNVVDLEHRRNLYSVIVGAEGVLLAQQINTLDANSRAKSAEIRDKSAAVQAHIPAGSGLTVESFSDLPNDAEIDTKIAAKERELDAVKQAAKIRTPRRSQLITRNSAMWARRSASLTVSSLKCHWLARCIRFQPNVRYSSD